MRNRREEHTIGEIADVLGGGTPSTKDPSNFGGDVPWLTPKDLAGSHNRHIARGELNLSQKGLEKSSARLLPPNTILLSSRAPIGYVAIAENPIATNQGFRNLVLKPGFEPEYVYYWLTAHVPDLERLANGSTFMELSGSSLKQVAISTPPLPEQRAIAHILSTLDDKIELNRRMNEMLETMARALFKSWFIDFDPVHAKAEGHDPGLPADVAALFPDSFQDSDLGEIPKGWKAVPLPDVIEVNPVRGLRQGSVAPYLDMGNMPVRGHSPDVVRDRSYNSGMRFVNGDTLVARITPCLENGKTAYVDFLDAGQIGWGSTEYIVLRPKPPLPTELGYCLARSDGFRDFAIQSMTGTSGRQRVATESLFHFLVVSPPRRVAELFGELVRPLFVRSGACADESRTLALLRDTLLPKLLSGEVRVKDVDQSMEAHV